VGRIVDAAARLFGAEGFQGASMDAVARAAGVSKGLLHYHFRSKEHLLVEAQRATFHKIHERFEARFEKGERGLPTALEGIDALWQAVLEMRGWAPFLIQTMSLAAQERPIRTHVDDFYRESMILLERGVRNVFSNEAEQLAVPPDRLAMLIRTSIHGLVVELSYARTPSELARVDQAYRDLREFFARAVLAGPIREES
jgi:AcrR family transcriptional regulator